MAEFATLSRSAGVGFEALVGIRRRHPEVPRRPLPGPTEPSPLSQLHSLIPSQLQRRERKQAPYELQRLGRSGGHGMAVKRRGPCCVAPEVSFGCPTASSIQTQEGRISTLATSARAPCLLSSYTATKRKKNGSVGVSSAVATRGMWSGHVA